MNEREARSAAEGGRALWCLDSVTPAELARLRRAFGRSPELRTDLEQTVLTQLSRAIGEQFVVAFAIRHAGVPHPPMAVLPALIGAMHALLPRERRSPPRRASGSSKE